MTPPPEPTEATIESDLFTIQRMAVNIEHDESKRFYARIATHLERYKAMKNAVEHLMAVVDQAPGFHGVNHSQLATDALRIAREALALCDDADGRSK